MKRTNLFSAAVAVLAMGLSGGSAQRFVSDVGMPIKKRIHGAAYRYQRGHTPHRSAKEQAKVYAEFTNPRTGHMTVGRIG